MLLPMTIIAVASVIIWWFSNKLEDVAHVIGQHLKIPASVKGALLYAIPSSFPEFSTAIIAVLVLKTPQFSIGVGTVAGSAVFNILIIPAFSFLFAEAAFKKKGKSMQGIKISSNVFFRDGVFYLLVVIVFIAVTLTGKMTRLFAIIFLLMYGFYILILYTDTTKHRASLKTFEKKEKQIDMKLHTAMLWMLLCMFAVGIACYFLVEFTIELAKDLHINTYVIAVILTAAATSVPDTVISVAAAKKGGDESEEAIVNAFSSNIFDILVCLSVPVLFYKGTLVFNIQESIVSIALLALITFITLVMLRFDHAVTRKKSYVLLFFYCLFILSAIYNQQILKLLSLF